MSFGAVTNETHVNNKNKRIVPLKAMKTFIRKKMGHSTKAEKTSDKV